MTRFGLVVAVALVGVALPGGDAWADLLGNREGGSNAPEWSWLPEPARDLIGWVVVQQAYFAGALRDAVAAYRSGESLAPALGLIAISFFYGVFHAVGPGHGKAVVTGYFLARESDIRRGLLLGWLIAGIQASVAIILVGFLGWFLDFSRLALLDSMPLVELGSYGLVVLLGAGMTYAVIRGHECGHDHGSGHKEHAHHHHLDVHDGRIHESGTRRRVEFLSAAVVSGIRPCTGALIVLLFALANGVFLVGAIATIAMGVGVAITVSMVGITAILVRRGLMRFSLSTGEGVMLPWVPRGLAFLGSVAVCLIGLVLFMSALGRVSA